ncbi:MAG: hypothetical protein M5R36_06500 [Deltaproteobacteria bacterium]|nr:hypothetical protein [Deltaproteobacteria bacterium]
MVLLLALTLVGCGWGDPSSDAGADSDDDENPGIDDDSGDGDDDTFEPDDDFPDHETGSTTTTTTRVPTTTSTTTTTIAHTEDCTPSWITPVQLPDPTTFPIDPPYRDGDVVRRQYFAATAGNTGIDIAVDAGGVAHIATMLGIRPRTHRRPSRRPPHAGDDRQGWRAIAAHCGGRERSDSCGVCRHGRAVPPLRRQRGRDVGG